VQTEFSGEQCGVQVNLTPLGAFTLLGRPSSDITNQCVPLDALEAPDLARLPGRLAEEPDWPARFARVDSVLRSMLDRSNARPDPEVARAWRRLVVSGGAARVAELAAYTGWSRRHLLNRFRAQVGLAPKTAARVLRFSRAADLLVPTGAGGGPPGDVPERNVAAVAAATGYSDHSHLVRDFRALAGCSPSQYVAEWRTG
jgi:AraC-like DNA-binding protein